MTILEHDPVVIENVNPGAQSQEEPWRVSKGEAGWSDRQTAAGLIAAAAGALALAISLYLLKNKSEMEVV